MASARAIEAAGLRKSYGDVQALCGVDLSVEAGTVYGLLGPNGAGKTTAVRILTTLLPLDSGLARVAGFDVVADGPRVRERIGSPASTRPSTRISPASRTWRWSGVCTTSGGASRASAPTSCSPPSI